MHLRASGCKDLRCTETCQGFSHLAGFKFDSAEPLTPAPSVNYTWPLELGMKSGTGTEKLHFVMIYSLVALAVKCSLRSLRAKSQRRLVTTVNICAMGRNMTKGREPLTTLMRFQSPTHWEILCVVEKSCGNVWRGWKESVQWSDAKAEVQLRLSRYWRCGGIKTRSNLNVFVCPVWTHHNLRMWWEAHNHAQLRFGSALSMLFDVVRAEIQHAGDCHNWRVRVDESRFPV